MSGGAIRRRIGRLRQNSLVQKLLLPLGTELRPERWIFVVGCYNSGTTVLSRILACHPEVAGLPDEGVFYTDALPYPEQYGWTRLWYRCYDQVRLEPWQLPPGVITRIKKQWSLSFGTRRANLVEKSVVNTARTPFLQEHFQPAHFVYLVRDGYAVAEGIRRKARPGAWGNPEYREHYPIGVCAEQWQVSDDVFSRDAVDLDRLVSISYEELTDDPIVTLRRVTDFLGIPPLPSEAVTRTWELQGRNEPLRNMNEDSFARLTPEDLDAVEAVAGEVLAKYGYARPGT